MVILTEKPSVARDIAVGLGDFHFIKSDSWWQRGNSDCIIYAAGHLLELFSPEDYDKTYKSWNLTLLPIVPEKFEFKPKSGVEKMIKTIKRALKKFGEENFILATDADREGELIGYLILKHIGFKSWNTAKRFWVSEALTPETVRNGISNASQLSQFIQNRKSGLARMEADWLIGINLTRLLTKISGKLLHFGRVQTCILSLIYQRDSEIDNFKPQDVYHMEAQAHTDNFHFTMTLEKYGNKDSDTLDAETLKKLTNFSGPIKIVDVKSETNKESPPYLFSLTSLQRYCSEKLGIPPDKTLNIAQSLYEKYKCLSYPRTASSVLGNSNADYFVEKFKELSEVYQSESTGCSLEKASESNKHIFDSQKVEGHHALIPLKPIPSNASDDEKKVYMAVLQRFFQILKPDYISSSIKITATDGILFFTTKNTSTVQLGWKSQDDLSGITESPSALRNIQKDDVLSIDSIKLIKTKTRAKKHFTNSSLLSLMENPREEKTDENGRLAGIGTPATRAAIISDLIQRQYLKQKGQSLLITQEGKFLIETAMTQPELKSFMSIRTTTKWEEQLNADPENFLESVKEFLRKVSIK